MPEERISPVVPQPAPTGISPDVYRTELQARLTNYFIINPSFTALGHGGLVPKRMSIAPGEKKDFSGLYLAILRL